MRKSDLIYEQFEKLPEKEKQKQYKKLSNHDKFKMRISATIKHKVIEKSTLSTEKLKRLAEEMKEEIQKNNSRWINEISGIKDNGKKRKKKQKNLEMLSRTIKLMNGLIVIKPSNVKNVFITNYAHNMIILIKKKKNLRILLKLILNNLNKKKLILDK